MAERTALAAVRQWPMLSSPEIQPHFQRSEQTITLKTVLT